MRISDWSSDVCSSDLIKVRVLHSGVGGITESDVTLAGASGAPIIGFNVRPNAKAREIAERSGVELQYYDVIYHLTDAVKAAMAGELGPLMIENVVGRAEIREVFSAGKHGRSEEHTSELQSLMRISYAVFCLNKKNNQTKRNRKQEMQSRQ